MDALELASTIEKHWPNTPEKFNRVHQAACLLRRQHSEITLLHEAIQKLREALALFARYDMLPDDADMLTTMNAYHDAIEAAKKALKDTAQFDSFN